MDEVAPVPPPRRGFRLWRALAWGVGGLVALVLMVLLGIDTGPGHRLIADRIAAMKPTSGLRIRIGRIDGSIWTRSTLRDVELYDLNGRFFQAPAIALDWHPLAWAHNKLDIDRVAADLVRLDRLPKLKPGRPGQPILPGFDIRIASLDVKRLRLGKAVAGSERAVSLKAKADIHAGRAMIGLNAGSDMGDRLMIDLDAVPDGDRFRLAADATGPSGGVLGGLFGTKRPVEVKIGGSGGWHVWNGSARATLSGKSLADLALGVRDGKYLLSGSFVPSDFIEGKLQRLSAPRIAVKGEGTYGDRRLTGTLALASAALKLVGHGTIDLAKSGFDGFVVDADLLQPASLFPNMSGRNIRLNLHLDGPFSTAAYRYQLASPHFAFDATGFDNARAAGSGRLSKLPILLPIQLQAARVTGVGTVAGGILANLSVAGVLKIDAKTLEGSDLALTSDKLKGKLALHIDLVSGDYNVALTGGLARYLIPGLGIVDVQTKVSVLPGPGGRGSVVSGTGQAIVRRFDNAFLASLAGGNPRVDTRLVRDPAGIIHFSNTVIGGPAIRITGSGIRRNDGSFQFAGQGSQTSYGTFRIQLDGQIDHPQVRLVLDSPVPSLGLSQVRFDLDPVADGFAFRANGGSTLGPFTARGNIHTPTGGAATTIEVADLAVTGTHGHGILRSDPGGFTGRLDLAGGGIGGALLFSPVGTLQKIEPHLTFANAALAAGAPIGIRQGRADASILLDPAGVAIDGTMNLFGINRGTISLARASATARLRGGYGSVATSISSAGGRAFNISARADIGPGRARIFGQGDVEGRPIRLTTPAVLTMQGDAWTLAPTILEFAGGKANLTGTFTSKSIAYQAGLDQMPLRIFDIVSPSLALGGQASGTLSYRHMIGQAPSGRADVTVRGLTRSGLVLSSTPVDLGLAAVLTADGAAGRAVIASGGKTIGRAQARIAPLPPGSDIVSRLTAAPLFAQLRYAGPADTLWRLIGVETIDVSGPLSVSADIGGTPADPVIKGQLSTNAGRLESAVTGTVISQLKAQGNFSGSSLTIDQLSGRAGGGTVTGRASFDIGAGKGLSMDIALNADHAVLLNTDTLGATVTGPLTMKSTGNGGTIAGDVLLERSRFKLGAAAAAQVPNLPVKEVNRAPDEDDVAAPVSPWRLAVKARARNQLMVSGLGLDSEWRADLTIGGSVDNPAIGGRADLVRGGYEFAGRRFDLQRGIIRFTGTAPTDPILDIVAQANIQDVNATIQVGGTGLTPQISFQSVPALPEDELLSRLLFGTSITNLSAPEALQLAAAVASLRSSGGGGGLNLDPINALRKAVRLDRLRILPADPTTGQRTSIAAGKYLGRRTYIEFITDGAGYSATSIEFRITRWLSLLSTISTVGRQSANVKVSKDY